MGLWFVWERVAFWSVVFGFGNRLLSSLNGTRTPTLTRKPNPN